MTDERFVQALVLRLEPAWRRLPEDERRADALAFAAAAAPEERGMLQETYSTIGLRAEGDLLLWRMAERIEDLEQSAARALACGVGRWMSVALTLIGLSRPSQYVKRPSSQEQSLFTGERSRYLVVYPFVKSVDWYLTPLEKRKQVMAGHMRIGHRYSQVRQLLAYSFGLDDQEFVVAYETDDLVAFQDLVRELRETEARRSTVRDTPIITGIRRPIGDVLDMLSGRMP
ncbi:MAG TPA: chlorite dismutase family protein [Candidatus Limnocylindria bacterium]|nr:chlorite dismutase family protein [Candidatus Limnocylindria bacterium]